MSFSIKQYVRPLFLEAEPYPLIKNFSNGFTELVNTNPFLGNFSAYPDPNQIQLKKDYTIYLNEKNNSSLSEENVLFTAGCTEGIDLILKAFCEPLIDKIGIYKPSIFLFEYLAGKNGVEAENIWLEGKFFEEFPLNKKTCKVNFLCNPNNPTGVLHPIEFIEKELQSSNAIYVVDETYLDFTEAVSASYLIKKYPNLVIVKSFSKGWGLAGLRSGVTIANPDIIKILKAIQLPFSVNMSAIKGIQKSLSNLNKINISLNKINKNRKFILIKLNKSKNIKKIYPSFTNFIFLEILNMNSFYKKISSYPFHITDFSQEIPSAIRFSLYKNYHNNLFVSLMCSD